MRTLRITTRGWSVLVVAAAVGVIGRLLGSLELLCAGLAGAFAFAAMLLLSTFSRPPHVSFGRVIPASVLAGDDISIQLVARTGRRRTAGLVIEEWIAPGASRVFGLAPMRAHQTRTLGYTLDAGGRGLRTIGPCEVTQSDPLGFTRRVGIGQEAVSLVVWPQPRLAEIPDTYTKSEPVPASVRTAGIDHELSDIRPFVDGDEVRRVHWRTTARTGQLMVRTDAPSTDRARPLIVIDGRDTSHTAGSLELALSLACGYAMAEGYSPQFVVATRGGTASFTATESLLGALARVPRAGGKRASGLPLAYPSQDPVDLLIVGPHTEVEGSLRHSHAVLRCAANGSTYTLLPAGDGR